MRYEFRLAAILACAALAAPVASEAADSPAAPARAAEKGVTTTWLPDPFPNLAPRALDRQAIVEVDTPRRTPGVLLGVYDVENDPLSVASFTQPAHGSATLEKDGAFRYAPRAGYTGRDEFTFTLSDGRGGLSTAAMRISVIRPTGRWSTTSLMDLAEIQANGEPIQHGKGTTVPRAVDWDGDGKLDLLVGAGGAVWLYRNVGTPAAPQFAAGSRVKAAGKEIALGTGRMSIAWVDMDGDGRKDLVVIAEQDRKVRWYRNETANTGEPALAAESILRAKGGGEFVAGDVRVDVADWNGDRLPDLIIGSRSGEVKIAYNVGTPSAPLLEAPTAALDTAGLAINGSYNINVRVADINQDDVPDLIDSYNWGNVNFRINTGTAARPRLPETGRFSVSGPNYAQVNLHGLCDGPIVDVADLNGDGTIDLVVGGEVGGRVRLALGQSAKSYLDQIDALIAAHPQDLATFLADPANAAAKGRMQSLQGALYDYVVSFATPGQKDLIAKGLVERIKKYPPYFSLQPFDVKRQPGLASLAIQTWLTLLVADYYDPAARKALADAAGLTGGYRKLVEETGLIYADNNQNPRGAEAIHDWLRTIPREVYPGTCITARDWLGDCSFLVRGHMKNTFNGKPVDNGEYGFGGDARAVIGDRGSENWFMTVVRHEACHDLDAYVRRFPDLNRRWGQTLALAGGPDMRADPASGWLSMDLTRRHFKEAGLWDGSQATWEATWKKYWTVPPGSGWRQFGFMRGGIDWFYGAPQESLATQGNQFWNSTEGRLEVAIARWNKGYTSNLTEVLFFLDIWSLGLGKMKFYETDNACNQVIGFARLGRNGKGYINRIDLGDRYYQFDVDDKGMVKGIVHVPEKKPAPG
jgi:hypothetical protein